MMMAFSRHSRQSLFPWDIFCYKEEEKRKHFLNNIRKFLSSDIVPKCVRLMILMSFRLCFRIIKKISVTCTSYPNFFSNRYKSISFSDFIDVRSIPLKFLKEHLHFKNTV